MRRAGYPTPLEEMVSIMLFCRTPGMIEVHGSGPHQNLCCPHDSRSGIIGLSVRALIGHSVGIGEPNLPGLNIRDRREIC